MLTRQLELIVNGMHCAVARSVKAAVQRLEGIRSVFAEPATGLVRVGYDPARLDVCAVSARLAAAGFPAAGTPTDEAERLGPGDPGDGS